MTVTLSLFAGAGAQFLDNNGNPLSGGKIYTYQAGTTTPLTTYTTNSGTIAHTNPIVLDAAGRVPSSGEIWLTDSVGYKFVLKNSNDVLLATWDNISGNNDPAFSYYTPNTGSLLAPGPLTVKSALDQITNEDTGASKIGYLAPFTGSVTTTVEGKLAQTVSVKDFGAACDWNGSTGTDDTTAIQAALDYAYSLPGIVEVVNPGASKVTATLILGSNVIFRGGSLTCTTDNIPIIKVSKDALNSYWQVKDMGLVYVNPQVAFGGKGNAICLGDVNTVAYEYEISNVSTNNARSAVSLPTLVGAFAFLGRHTNIRSYKGTGPAFEIIGSATGAHTTLTFTDCYYQGEAGSEISTASLFSLYRVTGLTVNNCACDRTAKSSGALAYFESCIGNIETIVSEGNLLSRASDIGAFYQFAGSKIVVNNLIATANTVTLTGSGSFGFIRANDSSQVIVDSIQDLNNTVSDSSSGNYYTIVIDANSILYNNFFNNTGASPGLSTNEIVTNNKFYARRLNGSDRTRIDGGCLVMFGTAPPTTGTFDVGDKLINTTVNGVSPVTQWQCVVAGTPGTWRAVGSFTGLGPTANRPTLTASDRAVMYFDTTLDADGKPIWWTGTAWVDATGAVV